MPQQETARLSPLVFGRSSRSLGSQVLPASSMKTSLAWGPSPGNAALQSLQHQKPSPPPPSAHLHFSDAGHRSSTPSSSRQKTGNSNVLGLAAPECAFPSKGVAAASWSTPCARRQAPPCAMREGTTAQRPTASIHLSTPVTTILRQQEPSERATTFAQPRDSPSAQKRLQRYRSTQQPAVSLVTPAAAKLHASREEPQTKDMSSSRLMSTARPTSTFKSIAQRQQIQLTPTARSSSSQLSPGLDHRDSPVAQGSGATTLTRTIDLSLFLVQARV